MIYASSKWILQVYLYVGPGKKPGINSRTTNHFIFKHLARKRDRPLSDSKSSARSKAKNYPTYLILFGFLWRILRRFELMDRARKSSARFFNVWASQKIVTYVRLSCQGSVQRVYDFLESCEKVCSISVAIEVRNTIRDVFLDFRET